MQSSRTRALASRGPSGAHTVERALDLREAAIAERCVVCDAVAERSIALEPVTGAELAAGALAVSGRTVRVCRSCDQAQFDAKRYGTRAMWIAVLAIPVVALVVGLVLRRPDGIATTAGALLGFGVAKMALGTIERRRARSIPLLVIGSDGDEVLAQVNAPPLATSVTGYRDAPKEARREPRIVSPRPPRAPMGLAWAGSLLLTLAVVSVGWSGAIEVKHTLVIDSPRADVTVVIDSGDDLHLAAGGRSVSKITSGSHSYRVTYLESGRVEDGSFDVSAFDDTLFTTDPAQCYAVWVDQGAHAKFKGAGSVRWARVQSASSSERCADR